MGYNKAIEDYLNSSPTDYSIYDPGLLQELRDWAAEHSKNQFASKVLRVYTKCRLLKKNALADKILTKYLRELTNLQHDDRVLAFHMMLKAALDEKLDEHGYSNTVTVPHRGRCGLRRMAFTVGLFYGIDDIGYKGRYCFHSYKEAAEALVEWSGTGDPPGNWIKHKGYREYRNPNYKEND